MNQRVITTRRISRRMKKRIRNRRLIKFTVALSIMLIMALSSGSILSYAGSNKEQEHHSNKYYMSIQIQYGDTLSDIASRYFTSEYNDIDELVREILQTNHLEEDQPIHSGQYLIIPYYQS